MTCMSRGISKMMKANARPSQTPGKDKGGSCVKSDLKTWGITANPYKLHGGDLSRYDKYRELTSSMNK